VSWLSSFAPTAALSPHGDLTGEPGRSIIPTYCFSREIGRKQGPTARAGGAPNKWIVRLFAHCLSRSSRCRHAGPSFETIASSSAGAANGFKKTSMPSAINRERRPLMGCPNEHDREVAPATRQLFVQCRTADACGSLPPMRVSGRARQTPGSLGRRERLRIAAQRSQQLRERFTNRFVIVHDGDKRFYA
jgi:hypothetical protein